MLYFMGMTFPHKHSRSAEGKEKHNFHFVMKNLLDEVVIRFDVVMAIDVLEHIEDYFGSLRQEKRDV